jgi:hypothetical protein
MVIGCCCLFPLLFCCSSSSVPWCVAALLRMSAYVVVSSLRLSSLCPGRSLALLIAGYIRQYLLS